MSSNNVGHTAKPITTPQHFATLHHTSLNYTSLHLSILHYPLIWLNPFTFPIVLFHLISLNDTQYSSHLQTHFQNNEPLQCPKEPPTISLNYLFLFFSLILSTLHFTSLHFAIHIYNSLPFTFYFLSSSLPITDFHFPNPRFENMRFTVGSPYRPFR